MNYLETFKRSVKLFFALIPLVGHTQVVDYSNRDYRTFQHTITAPLSPQTRDFSAIPVSLNMYNGKLDLQIPFYEIAVGDVKVPISLSYNSGGVNVTAVASPIGLNWSLNAGGAITRIVKGSPDEIDDGTNINSSLSWSRREGYLYSTSQPTLARLNELGGNFEIFANGSRDTEPDEFTYTFMGRSGKFYLDCNGEIYTVPLSKIKIKFDKTGLVGGCGTFTKWIITDEGGNEFHYSSAEINNIKLQNNIYYNYTKSPYIIPNETLYHDVYPYGYISSWSLDKIKTIGGQEINFEYTDKSFQYLSNQSHTYDINQCNVTNTYIGNTQSLINTKKLSRIYFDIGEVKFLEGNARCDLKGDNTLSSIEVYNKQLNTGLTLLKKFNFQYNYHSPTGLILDETCPATNTDYWKNNLTDPQHVSTYKRLLLKSIQEVGNGVVKPSYEFNYLDNLEVFTDFQNQ